MASKSAAQSMQRVSVPKGGMGLGGLIPKKKPTPGAAPRLEDRPDRALRAKALAEYLRRMESVPTLDQLAKLKMGGKSYFRNSSGQLEVEEVNARKRPRISSSDDLRIPELDSKFLYRMDVLDRADLLTKIPAESFDNLCEEMDVTKEYLLTTLKMSAATLGRKAKSASPLSSDEAEKVLGVVCLIGQVAVMVEESGDSNGFDAAKWFAEWIKSPNAALGGRRADELLSFGDGRQLLSGLLSQMQAGTYA